MGGGERALDGLKGGTPPHPQGGGEAYPRPLLGPGRTSPTGSSNKSLFGVSFLIG